MEDAAEEVTQLLGEWNRGDRSALERLTPIVYGELRRIAEAYLRRESPGHTLQPTALVHEAYLRLVHQSPAEMRTRTHFFGIAAQLMRQILVDHARHHQAAKRAGGRRVSLSETVALSDGRAADLLSLHEAMEELEKIDARKTQVVELRFFGGLSIEETAEALDLSVATVHREIKMAETWLYQRLSPKTT